MKILLIEDNDNTVRLLSRGLREHGFLVEPCKNGSDGIIEALSGDYDAIVLDVMLPGIDGWKVLERLREQNQLVPVLMLTARDSVEHRVRGLNLGADDYLVKPFSFAELIARLQAILRRRSNPQTNKLSIADLEIDLIRQHVRRNTHIIELTAKEFLLLCVLVEHQDEVLTRTLITERVWDMNFDRDSNLVDVHIRRLRSKVDDPFDRKLIHTVRGRGYVVR